MSAPLRWTVVVPVKVLSIAKSRLDRPDRGAVALAMAQDTVTAALAAGARAAGRAGAAGAPVAGDPAVTAGVGRATRTRPDGGVGGVVVVTDDPRAAAALAGPGVVVVADEPAAGLNPALTHGAAVAAARWPDRGVAALSADIPAVDAGQLRVALAAAAGHARSVLADAAGTGTVLLAVRPGLALGPAYGVDSRAAHVAGGAYDLTPELGDQVPGLRRDVDTLVDLAAAVALGAGPHTRAALNHDRPGALDATG